MIACLIGHQETEFVTSAYGTVNPNVRFVHKLVNDDDCIPFQHCHKPTADRKSYLKNSNS